MNMTELAFLLLSVAAVSLPVFSMVVVIKWAQERRREREAYYLSEMVKKLADSPSTSPAEFLREFERNKSRRLREGMKLSGFIGTFASAALFIFAWTNSSGGAGYLVTLIPLFACGALYIYAQFLAPRD